jgi:chloride channel protein, CIC family
MPESSPQANVREAYPLARYSLLFWLLVLLTGLGAGIGGGLLMKLLRATQHLCWSYQEGTFVEGVEQTSPLRHVLVLAAAGGLAGGGRLLLRRATGGHGGEISQTIWFQDGRFPTFRTVGSAVLSIAIVGMGASLGREGALKQMGAAVASRLASWSRLSPAQHRLLAACGAGAGMAAAYNVPFGGALFALEVLLGELTLPLVLPALAASFVATGISWLLLPDQPTYQVPAYSLSMPQLCWAIPAGLLFGLASVLWVRAIGWADAVQPRGWRRLVPPIFVFAALGAIAIPFPQLLGNGKDAVQLAFLDQLPLLLLLALPGLKLLASAGSLASGAPGGFFTPTIMYGAVLGGLLGYGWCWLWPGSPVGSYAILGAGGVLAAATQGPVSALVLLFELTWWTGPLTVPLLMVIVAATLVARLLKSPSIYSARIKGGREAAVLAPAPPTDFDDLLSRDCAVVSAATHYSEIMPVLLTLLESREPLYVVDEKGRPIGQIPLNRLARARNPGVPEETATAADLADPVPTVRTSSSRADVKRRLQEAGVAQLPVIDGNERLVGYVAETVRSASR